MKGKGGTGAATFVGEKPTAGLATKNGRIRPRQSLKKKKEGKRERSEAGIRTKKSAAPLLRRGKKQICSSLDCEEVGESS